MVEEFKSFIGQQRLFQPRDKVLLAVSGGVDSMVMAYLFHHCGYRFAIAHCNFQLRDKESDLDEEFVGLMAKKYKVDFFTRRFDTQNYAKEEGISLQMAARHLRYDWFAQLLAGHEYKYLALAHHLNDSFETALFNLVKGTGLAGLKGIAAKNSYRIRPLLFADKEKIRSFGVEQGVQWREDSSNASIKYNRNLIRHEVIPLLEKINPDLINSFAQSSEKILAAGHIVSREIEAVKEKLLEASGEDFFIDKKALKELQEGSFLLSGILKSFGFNFSQVCDIYSKLDSIGKLYFSESYQLNIDRAKIIISPVSPNPSEAMSIESGRETLVGEGFSLSLSQVPAEGFSIPDDKNSAAVDLDKLKFPLKIRPWKKGDWFMPLGMRHKKKLSDFMIDEKIPLNLKSRILVLESAEDIVWVIGYRIDDRYKITSHSRQVFVLKKTSP